MRRLGPYRLYLILESGTSFLIGITSATIMVYWVLSGRLNPLELLLLGTALELSYFVFQLPTGVLADLVSRRMCVLAGLFIVGLALVMQGVSASFANLIGAQVVLGFGAALNGGAEEAWIADELADADMSGVYLRATQLGLVGTIAGSLLSGVIALAGLNVPLIAGGSGICLFSCLLAFVMPERNFQRRQASALAALADQTRAARRAIVAVPGLALLFGMTMFVGLWGESFDRLWGAFLLRDIRFPHGLRPVIWFSLFACAVAVLSLGSTEIAKRRTQRLGAAWVADALLVLTLAIGIGVIVMATARGFAVAVAAYLVISVLRPVFDPLIDGWMVTRIEPSVRATALSAREMFDSGGQIIGGPVIGVIGTLTSIRIALMAGAAALVPAAGCLVAASRRIRPRFRAVSEASAADLGAVEAGAGLAGAAGAEPEVV
ncbi:MAG TPA: MFS transporter [Streptosporangiaceae bacterium]|nr:MFS transporter [Streptosporangiaceae bacterium]